MVLVTFKSMKRPGTCFACVDFRSYQVDIQRLHLNHFPISLGREFMNIVTKMKDHMKNYFPERFENRDTLSLSNKALMLLTGLTPSNHKLKCELRVANVFTRSNELKLLVGAMRKYGCNFNLSRHVSCELCRNCNGGYDPDTNQIIVCSNSQLTDNKIMATMMHEMIHMFDYCRAEFDFNNLDHIACSEVSNL